MIHGDHGLSVVLVFVIILLLMFVLPNGEDINRIGLLASFLEN
jgi:hypothetical protein